MVIRYLMPEDLAKAFMGPGFEDCGQRSNRYFEIGIAIHDSAIARHVKVKLAAIEEAVE
jgi:hypothetical protein